MPLWRYRIQKTLVPPLVRLNLLSLGFFYIPIRGSVASPEQAPVLVSNHQTFVDIWLWLWQLLPVGVRCRPWLACSPSQRRRPGPTRSPPLRAHVWPARNMVAQSAESS
jgi:hypothetical protein